MTIPNNVLIKKSCENYPKWMFWKRRRYMVAVFAFFGLVNVYILRSNLSIAVVAMTENKTRILENGTIIYGADFNWDSKIQGYVLSSFFYGYITTQLFGGWLSAKIGGKRVLGAGTAATAILTLMTPWLTSISVYLLIALRIVEGILGGGTYPCIQSVWAQWAPPLERSRLVTFAYSGTFVGTVVSMPASAYLAKALGWESIFYVSGAFGLIWCAFWWVFIAESPAEDPRITLEELEYIKQALGNAEKKKTMKHPWKKIFTCVPFWAIVFAHFADNWGFYTLITQLPTFLKDMFSYDLGKTGFLSSIPYLAMAIMIAISGSFADWFCEKKIFTTTQVRKIFTCCSFIVHAVFMLAAVYWPSPVQTVVFLVISVGLGVCAWSGFGVNFLDIAPQHASVLMGISNTVGTASGVLTPIVTGYVVTDASPEQWQIVFCIASALFFIATVIYGVFASGELQPWAAAPLTVDEETTDKDPV